MTSPNAAAPATEVTASERVRFPDGIPGFESCREWVVLADDQTPLRRLQAVDGDAAFLAVDPRSVMDGYRCELTATDRHRLGVIDDTPLLWLALVIVEPAGALTVNLRAPIVINPRTMLGQQVLPQDSLYPLRHVLLDGE
jgi:flagellar assembly factor FliW